MTFEEHLAGHRNADGTYDLAAAEAARALDIASSDDSIVELAAKAAKNERRAWEARERDNLRETFAKNQQTMDFGRVDLDLKVPLGDSVVVALGDMNRERIRIRKDLRLKTHLDEGRAFDAEMTFWLNAEGVLGPDDDLRSLA